MAKKKTKTKTKARAATKAPAKNPPKKKTATRKRRANPPAPKAAPKEPTTMARKKKRSTKKNPPKAFPIAVRAARNPPAKRRRPRGRRNPPIMALVKPVAMAIAGLGATVLGVTAAQKFSNSDTMDKVLAFALPLGGAFVAHKFGKLPAPLALGVASAAALPLVALAQKKANPPPFYVENPPRTRLEMLDPDGGIANFQFRNAAGF